ncbi:hypothetical protein ACUR5C_14860 [Aliikangiella sp. IMCC44653]
MKRNISRMQIGILLMMLILSSWCASSSEHNKPVSVSSKLSLDSKIFDGKIRAKGVYGLFRVKGTILFSDGLLTWRVASEKNTEQAMDYAPANYTVKLIDELLYFTSIMPGQSGDKLIWSGIYDGQKLNKVEAIWVRQKGDWVHDLLLPEEVILRFTPDKIQR